MCNTHSSNDRIVIVALVEPHVPTIRAVILPRIVGPGCEDGRFDIASRISPAELLSPDPHSVSPVSATSVTLSLPHRVHFCTVSRTADLHCVKRLPAAVRLPAVPEGATTLRPAVAYCKGDGN